MFGSDILCCDLNSCGQCVIEMKLLQERQKHEKETYLRLQERQKDMFNKHDNQSPMTILWSYAISASWFKEWESFVLGKSHGEYF